MISLFQPGGLEMRTWLMTGFGLLLSLSTLVVVHTHFTRQEESLRAETRRAVAADRAKHERSAGRHIVLDCVEIQPTK